MKKLIVLCIFGALLFTVACTQSTPTKDPEVDEQAFTKVSEDDAYIYYQGNVTLKGQYSEYKLDSIFGGMLCFASGSETENKIPATSNVPWFCFDNVQVAKNMFGINDSEIFKDSIECLKGSAEIEISNYIVNKKEAAVRDRAILKNIISKEPFTTNCSLKD